MCLAFAESLVDGSWGSHRFVCFSSDMTFLYHLTNRPKDLLCVEACTSATRFCLRINALSSRTNEKFMSPCPNPEQSKPTTSQSLVARKQFIFLNHFSVTYK